MGLVTPRRESPPPIRRPNRKPRSPVWPSQLERVAELNGEWMRVGQYKNVASSNKTSKYVRERFDAAGRFEFASRTVEGEGVLYARLRTEGKG